MIAAATTAVVAGSRCSPLGLCDGYDNWKSDRAENGTQSEGGDKKRFAHGYTPLYASEVSAPQVFRRGPLEKIVVTRADYALISCLWKET